MIQTGPGPIRIDADDLQLKHRGKHIAVKIRQLQWPVILGCELEGTEWKAKVDLTDDLFASDVPGGGDSVAYWVQQKGGAEAFVKSVVVPNLNTWLAALFPPGEHMSPIEQVQAAILGIKFVIQPDGTVVAG